jgi:DNA repair protein RecO (recombination protein O)
VEIVGAPVRLSGDAGVAGLYLNELIVRLTERQDPVPVVFDAYAQTLARLAADEPLAWSLRRFERDLLQAIGYGLQLQHDGETGEPLMPDAHYRYVVEQGAERCSSGNAHALRGSGLKALRDMMREVIRFHLGGRELRAWRVLSMAAMSRR